MKFLSGNNRSENKVENEKREKSQINKYENIEEAKFTEIKDDNNK